MSPHLSQPDAPHHHPLPVTSPRHCPPRSHTRCHPSPTHMGHVTAPITAAHAASLCTSSLHGPHCPPRSHTHCVAAHLIIGPYHPPHSCTCCVATHLLVAWATSPPSQPHMPCCHAPCSCTGLVAACLT